MCSKDKELLSRALKGDMSAFEELISSNEKRIYNLCFRMMRNEQDAQDMAQEALIKAWKSLRNFHFKSAFSTWLYKIAVNTCLDELRKRKNNTQSIEDLSEKGIEMQDEESLGFADESALKSGLEQALDKLEVNEKLIIVLKDVQGYSYEEISLILSCPIGTVRSRLSRSRRKLADICIEMELYPDAVRQNMSKEAAR
ncbi:MAG: RNA polymerase sigma factor [Clostridia bacterium]|nr:RNA polymerase sigma factor [Clostridia bacterium]